MHQKIETMKGLLGSVTTGASVFIAWLPQVETLMRIAVSVVGVMAGLWTVRFYHHRTRILLEKEQQQPKPPILP